ncbi:MAG: hypothetical protein AAGJ86_04780 [Pseudomonadota bacterium]
MIRLNRTPWSVAALALLVACGGESDTATDVAEVEDKANNTVLSDAVNAPMDKAVDAAALSDDRKAKLDAALDEAQGDNDSDDP